MMVHDLDVYAYVFGVVFLFIFILVICEAIFSNSDSLSPGLDFVSFDLVNDYEVFINKNIPCSYRNQQFIVTANESLVGIEICINGIHSATLDISPSFFGRRISSIYYIMPEAEVNSICNAAYQKLAYQQYLKDK